MSIFRDGSSTVYNVKKLFIEFRHHRPCFCAAKVGHYPENDWQLVNNLSLTSLICYRE